MNRNILLIIGTLLLVGSATFTYFYFFGGEEVEDFGFENKEVVISEEGIKPQEISIQKRNSVVFINSSTDSITLTSDSDIETLELGSINPGVEYHTNLLNEVGEYTYRVEELGIEGKIVVYE